MPADPIREDADVDLKNEGSFLFKLGNETFLELTCSNILNYAIGWTIKV